MLGAAGSEWQRFLDAPPAGSPARAFAAADWVASWWRDLADDWPDEVARERAEANLAALAEGRAEVVVTGQQPGFLGGPLYTLYKVGAAIAAAEIRSAAGRPTLPLFWMGDDDDDRKEAFQPWLFDPGRRALLRGRTPAGPADRMVGAAPGLDWGLGERQWLLEQTDRNELAGDLARLWRRGLAEQLPWGRLQRRAILRLFRRTDLLVVSGNDGGLHGLAAPLYRELWDRRESWPQEVSARGQVLVTAGFTAQISAASLERFLNIEQDGRRLALPAGAEGSLPEASRLRPGVAARSLVQDWLFRPVGVVVGPGEVAYLKQLQSLYELVGVNRCSLLPRLFAHLGPTVPPENAGELDEAESASQVEIEAAASRVAEAAREALAEALRNVAGAEPARSTELARGQGQRWRRAVVQLLGRERDRALAARSAELPPWVQPHGKRQERSLAALWAAAIWGDPLVAAVLEASREYYRQVGLGNWLEFQFEVPGIRA
jgi:uncharacterized protein YllA (UPF0747 family)